jgi:hypothetical protein
MKTILFIGLPYQDYTKEIILELGHLGFQVKFYPIKLRSFVCKFIQSISPKLFKAINNQYHKLIIDKEKDNNYDILLFLQIHDFSAENFERIRTHHNRSRFILYNWDSVNIHDYRSYIKYFHSVYTFDPEDARQLNINYLPLFCISAFQHLEKKNHQNISVYFVGNLVNINRYIAIKAFIDYCKKEGIKFNYYLKCSPLVLTRLLMRGFFPSGIKFFNISKERFIFLIENATSVFDIPNHEQEGYTMRFMENLCAGKKIITNNARVLAESFYSDDRIFLFEDFNFSKAADFLNKELCNPEENFPEFHINSFLKKLLA